MKSLADDSIPESASIIYTIMENYSLIKFVLNNHRAVQHIMQYLIIGKISLCLIIRNVQVTLRAGVDIMHLDRQDLRALSTYTRKRKIGNLGK